MKAKMIRRSVINLAALLLAASALTFMFGWPSSGATFANRTWDGGGASNNWSEAANWAGDIVPVTGDVVIFDGTSTKNSSIAGMSVCKACKSTAVIQG